MPKDDDSAALLISIRERVSDEWDQTSIPDDGEQHSQLAGENAEIERLLDAVRVRLQESHQAVHVRTDLAANKYFQAEPRVITTAKAVGIGYVPWVFHFNDMVNSDSSPWIQMIQTAVFDGKVDEAIAAAKAKMKEIANE